MKRSSLSLVAAGALLAGVAAAPLRADDAEGKRLYRAKCSGCHRLHPKDEFTPDEWRRKLPEMAKRAKLTPEQLEVISRYLGVPADEPPTAGGTPATPTPAPSHGTATK